MNHRRTIVALSSVFMIGAIADAHAHRPFWSENNHPDLETAFVAEDPTESIVLNHEATCGNLDVWLTFYADEGDEIFIQSGVPNIPRLSSYRISAAIAGPGIKGSVVINTNELGAVLLPELAEPKFFVDRESQTESNVYFEQTFKAPASGMYFIAVWPTDWQTGKFWLTVGTEERFTDVDFPFFPEWIRRLKEFYEVDAEPAGGIEPEVEQCEPDESFVGESGGCSVVSGGGNAPWLAFFALGLWWLQRSTRRALRRV